MNNNFEQGDLCDFCRKDYLVIVEERHPYTAAHLQCPVCHSTYSLSGDKERIKELERELETIKSRIFEIEETLRSEDILPYGN